MSNQIKITVTTPAWLMQGYSVDHFLARLREGKNLNATDMLIFWSWDAHRSGGYTRVGDAEITLTVHSRDDLVSAQIKTLQAELDAVRAAWLTKQQEILERIGKLQALTNEVEA